MKYTLDELRDLWDTAPPHTTDTLAFFDWLKEREDYDPTPCCQVAISGNSACDCGKKDKENK